MGELLPINEGVGKVQPGDATPEGQEALRKTVEREILSARTIEDLAEAKRKSLSLDELSGWRQEAGQDIKKRLAELLVEATQRLIQEKGFH